MIRQWLSHVTLWSVLALSACSPPPSTSDDAGQPGGGGAVNRAPVFGELLPVTVNENASTTVTLTATDDDGDPVDFSVQAPPSFVTLVGATLTIAPTFTDSGAYSINVRVSDGETITEGTLNVTVVDVDPGTVGGNVVVNADARYTNATAVALAITATTSAGALSEMRFSNDGSTWSPFEPFAASKSDWQLDAAAVDGARTVHVELKNSFGSTVRVQDQIILDRTAPQLAAATVNGGQPYTTSTLVTVSVSGASDGSSGSGVVQLCVSGAGAAGEQCVASGATGPFTLTTGDGDKTLSVSVVDAVGIKSLPVTATVMLDNTPPTLSGIVLNGGATTTSSSTVTVTATANDGTGSGLGMIELSNDGASFTPQAWSPSVSHVLLAGYGSKTVYARVVDRAGNASATPVASATISYVRPPLMAMLDFQNGRHATSLANIQLSITPSYADSGMQQAVVVRPAGAPAPATPSAFTAHSAMTSVDVSGNGEGTQIIYVWLRDSQGAVSPAPATYFIRYDLTAPTVVSVRPANGSVETARNARIVVVFSEEMDASTLTSGNLNVSGGAGAWSFEPATRTATFSPSALYPSNTAVSVTISGVTDAAGNSLATPYTFSFTTGELQLISGDSLPAFGATVSANGPEGTLALWTSASNGQTRLFWSAEKNGSWTSGYLGVGTNPKVVRFGTKFAAVWNGSSGLLVFGLFEHGVWTFPAGTPATAGDLQLVASSSKLLVRSGSTASTALHIFDGASWSTTNMTTVGAPAIASNGTGFAIVYGESSGGAYAYRWRLHDGASWQAPGTLVNFTNAYPNGFALTSNGSTYAGAYNQGGVWAIAYQPATSTWKTAALFGGQSAIPVVATNGTTYAVAYLVNAQVVGSVYDGLAWTGNGGSTSPAYATLDNSFTSTGPMLLGAAGSSYFAAWTDYRGISSRRHMGNSWSNINVLAPAPTPSDLLANDLAAGAERASVTWTAEGESYGRVFDGTTWLAAEKLHAAEPSGNASSVFVAQTASFVFGEGRQMVVRSYSVGTGLSSASTLLSTSHPPGGTSTPVAVAFASNGKGVAAWEQSNGLGSAIFAAGFDGTNWGTPFKVVKSGTNARVSHNGTNAVISFEKFVRIPATSGPASYLRVRPFVVGWSPTSGPVAAAPLVTFGLSSGGPAVVASDGSGFRVAFDERADGATVGTIKWASSADGMTWSAPATIEAAAGSTTGYRPPVLAGGAAGYVVAYEGVNIGGRVRASTSTDWSTTSKIIAGSCAVAAGTSHLAAACGDSAVVGSIHSAGVWTDTSLPGGGGTKVMASNGAGFRVIYGDDTASWTSNAWSTPQTVANLTPTSIASNGTEYFALSSEFLNGFVNVQGYRSASGTLQSDGPVETLSGTATGGVTGYAVGSYWALWNHTNASDQTTVVYGRAR